jgi:hypothetical protein
VTGYGFDGSAMQPATPARRGPAAPRDAASPAAWWRCPNDPPCPHAAVVHDIEDLGDQTPTCCMDGCDCGQPGTKRNGAEA